jgi:hypothetical protein
VPQLARAAWCSQEGSRLSAPGNRGGGRNRPLARKTKELIEVFRIQYGLSEMSASSKDGGRGPSHRRRRLCGARRGGGQVGAAGATYMKKGLGSETARRGYTVA